MKKFKKESDIRRDKVLLGVVAIFLSIHTAFSCTYFASAAGSVRNDVVRLHILANSDSAEDQAVKLKVRDALLECNTKILSNGVSSENAHIYFDESKAELLKTAQKVLKENGFLYNATLTLEKEYFETRQYGTLTFPAGEYLAVKVILGEGDGHNWWCVMFPPLCVPAAESADIHTEKTDGYLTVAGEDIVNGGNKYVMKFKLLELYEEIREKIGV